MKKALVFILAACLSAMLFPSTAGADDGPVSTIGGTGVSVYPIFDTNIVMDREIIDITVKDGESKVSCQFFFHNTGEAVNLMWVSPAKSREATLTSILKMRRDRKMPGWTMVMEIPQKPGWMKTTMKHRFKISPLPSKANPSL